MALVDNKTSLNNPERPMRQTQAGSRLGRLILGLVGACLLGYGALALIVASAWGPGNSDELVSGGPELIPWYGLSSLGTLAAVGALALLHRPRSAAWALGIAAASLAAWTATLIAVV
jgi:hypothetical protein